MHLIDQLQAFADKGDLFQAVVSVGFVALLVVIVGMAHAIANMIQGR